MNATMPFKFASPTPLACACFVLCVALLNAPSAQTQTTAASHSASCTIDKSEPTEAQLAFWRGDFKKARPLLDAALAASPTDAHIRNLDIDVFVAQGKIEDARKKADAWIGKEPKSPYGILSEAEIRFAEGDWPEAYAITLKALAVDPCLAAAYEDLAEFESLAAYRATAHKHLTLAHQLAPNDQGIRADWIYSLPEEEYLPELRQYITDSKAVDEKHRKSLLASMDKVAARQENRCELAAFTGTATIPMVPIYGETVGVESWGLEISFNGKKRTLQIDTGASGFTLVQSTGATLNLPKIEKRRAGGLGDEGGVGTVLAKANSVRVGGLEFKNCEVDILDRTGIMGDGGALPGERLDKTDGLVGTDIFNRYAVTVDYIKHEIRLGALPQPQLGAKTPETLDALGGRTDPDWMDVDRVIDPTMQGWTKIYRRGHMLIMPTRISDAKGVGRNRLFIVDTGASTNLIDVKLAKEITHTEENTVASIGGLSGDVDKVFEAGKFTADFAGLRLPVTSMDSIDLSDWDGVTGFLGYPTLTQLIMHIDYRDNLMFFEAPGAKKK